MRRGLVIALLLALSALSACSNTFNGMGRDLEQNGDAIQRQF
jgi:predicted small secreted protein